MNHRLTVHCTASANGHPYSLEKIREDHKKRGFQDVGYHYVIQPNGAIEVGRDEEDTGAHVEGENKGNIGICMVGYDKFSEQQFASLRSLFDRFVMGDVIPVWMIFGHYEFESAKKRGKTCPNIRIADLIAWYLDECEGAIDKYILRGKLS